LLTAPLDSPELYNLRLLFKVDKILFWREKYYLYDFINP